MGAAGVAVRRATLIRDVKRDFGNPLLPLAPATASLHRRLQVEKLPVGRTGFESFQGHPLPPKFFTTGMFAAAGALCALESRSSAVVREPVHLWLRRGLARTGSGLTLHLHVLGLTQLSLNWAGGWGSGVRRPGSRCHDGEVVNRPGPKETGVLLCFLFPFVAAARSGDRRGR